MLIIFHGFFKTPEELIKRSAANGHVGGRGFNFSNVGTKKAETIFSRMNWSKIKPTYYS